MPGADPPRTAGLIKADFGLRREGKRIGIKNRVGDDMSGLITIEQIEKRILYLGERKVMLDSDLAELFREPKLDLRENFGWRGLESIGAD